MKPRRISVYIHEDKYNNIERASKVDGRTVNGFIVNSSNNKAKEVLQNDKSK